MECAVCHKEGAQQDPLRQRPLRVQRLPHPGHGQHLRPVPCRNLRRPHRHSPQDDGSALLPHARPGTPCDGGGGSADRLPQRRRAISTWRQALREMYSRGMAVPGGACGFWGACGAGISAGQFVAIATASTPLAGEPWGLSNRIDRPGPGQHRQGAGGPRCCKRDSFLAVLAAVDFAREHLGVEMVRIVPLCSYSGQEQPVHRQAIALSRRPTAGSREVAFLCVHNSCRSQMAEALGKTPGRRRV